ncbi:MAG: LacI family transcriptional regulator [Halanaerobiales bacterium]|nr:LacI family transcriptional regulator [Halanaerobiales bacterium]
MKTIKDVAKLAGLGIATVSRYVNGKDYVSADAKKKIELAMKQLDFQPNAVARSIKIKKTNTVALVLPNISNPFFLELAEAVETNLMENGYKVILCNTHEDERRERDYIDMILQNRVDGVVSATGTYNMAQRFKKNGVPVVWLDRFSGSKCNKVVSVTTDNYQGTVEAVEFLIKKGCQKLLHLGSNLGTMPAVVRYEAFRNVCAAAGIDYSFLVYKMLSPAEIDLIFEQGYDGVFAWNDSVAIKFMSQCLMRRLKIPEEIQIIGFDDIIFARDIYPALTTVRQPIAQLGQATCQILIKMMTEGEGEELADIVLNNQLVIRKTTKE